VIVADTNLIVARFLPGPLTPLAVKWSESHPAWAVPELWRFEFTNVLSTYVRNAGLDPTVASQVLRSALSTFLPNEYPIDQQVALNLAVRLRISSYDANYIALAELLGTPCVTHDTQLLERARKQTRSLGSIRHE
jgi:predicted nucleic acid-binding protein